MVALASTTATTSWWGTAASTTPRCGEGQGTTRRGRDRAQHNEVEWAQQRMEHNVTADVARLDAVWGRHHEAALGRVDGAVSHDERSEELRISVICLSVDGVD